MNIFVNRDGGGEERHKRWGWLRRIGGGFLRHIGREAVKYGRQRFS